jgi:hypothetical protein
MLFLLVGIAVVATLIAFMVPKKQVEASQVPVSPQSTTSRVQQAQVEAFKSPATK